MLALNACASESVRITLCEPFIAKVTTNPILPAVLSRHAVFAAHRGVSPPKGYKSYLLIDNTLELRDSLTDGYRFGSELNYLADGDVVRVNPAKGQLRVLFRRSSSYNSFLVTERCNSFCLMCSQPPRKVDDSFLVDEIAEVIPLIDPSPPEIGLTGGEPTLDKDAFLRLVRLFKAYLPNTALHVLTNGRQFEDLEFARSLANIGHADLMLGIPLYSDLSYLHDFVVQADGAYDQTIRGVINLKRFGVRVEIRTVIHKQTYARLLELAKFICRNLTFVDHVAFMGLEMTGFTKANLEALWIDPLEYQNELKQAVLELDRFRIRTSIYNHQLCLLDSLLHQFSVKSISDWKNECMPECQPCIRKDECGGFFRSARLRYSSHISPFVSR